MCHAFHSPAKELEFNYQPLHRFQASSFPAETQLLSSEWQAEALQVDQKHDDYTYVLQRCAVYLDPNYPTTTFQRPGVLHKTKWMVKLIYCLKICLFDTQIQKLLSGTITIKHQANKLTYFVTFATLIYSTWWIQCCSSVDATCNDLIMYQKLRKYQ